MEENKINYRAFLFAGICFIGAGAVFTAAVNPGIGAALIGLGVVWLVIGITKGKR